MRTLDQIRFEVSIKLIDDRLKVFEKFLDEAEEDNFNYPAIYQAIVANNKITEGESEVPENEELETEELDEEFPHKNRRLGKKHNKSAWLRKERKKSLHNLVDWTEKDWWQPVDDGGRRIGEKGNKLYTRKGRVTRDKFTEEPVTDEESVFTICDTNLSLDINSEIWTDEEISQAVEKYNTAWWNKYEIDGVVSEPDFVEDEDSEEVKNLKAEIRKFYSFLSEYNLNTLFEYWEKNR